MNALTVLTEDEGRIIVSVFVCFSLQGNEWDEHALEEAVRRVVADTIQWKPLDQ